MKQITSKETPGKMEKRRVDEKAARKGHMGRSRRTKADERAAKISPEERDRIGKTDKKPNAQHNT